MIQAGQPAIIGQEILTSEGELIGLFMKHAIPKRLSPEETVTAIKEQGGVVYLEHPYDTTRRNLREEAIERIATSIDVVEVVNGRSTADLNKRAEELRSTLGVPAGAGSDAHTLEEIGSVFIEMEAFNGPADFLAKLQYGKIANTARRGLLRRLRR